MLDFSELFVSQDHICNGFDERYCELQGLKDE